MARILELHSELLDFNFFPWRACLRTILGGKRDRKAPSPGTAAYYTIGSRVWEKVLKLVRYKIQESIRVPLFLTELCSE